MENYGKLVKQMHWPQVSPKKQEEMRKLRNSIDAQNRKLSSRVSMKNLPGGTDTEAKKLSMKRNKHSKSQVKINWKKFKNPMVPKEKPKKSAVVTDFLLQKRIQRDLKEYDMDEDDK